MGIIKKKIKQVIIFNGEQISKEEAQKFMGQLNKRKGHIGLWVRRFKKTLPETLQGIASVTKEEFRQALKEAG